MKNPSISRSVRSLFSRWFYGCTAAMALAAAPLHAEVTVLFNNTGLLNTAPADLGTVTLAFTIDGAGNATLDASTSNNSAAAAVNAWDGPVGTISHTGAYNSSFTLTMTGINPSNGSSKNLRLVDVIATGPTGGLVGIQGVNQFRIDDNNTEAIRFAATTVPAGSKIKIQSMDWRNATVPATQRAFSTSPAINVTNLLADITGTWDLSTSGFLLDASEAVHFGTITSGVTSQGYSLGGLRFDIVNASVLSAPTGLAVTTDGAKVDLNWNDTPSAVSYSVYRSETQGGPYGTAIATGLTSSDYSDTTVSTGTTYYYVVTASDANGAESPASAELAIAARIPAPSGLTRIQGDGVIELDWNDSNSPIFAFHTVYRAEVSGGPYTAIATDLTGSSHPDTTVTNGTTYYYVVTATDDVVALESNYSLQVSGTPFAPVTAPTLFAHLDASIAESVTADDGEIVSLWEDRTDNSLNATSLGGAGEVFYPSLTQSDTGLDGMEFGFSTIGSPRSTLLWFPTAQQNSWLNFNDGSAALPYGGFSVFAVVHPHTILGELNRDVVLSSSEQSFSLRYEAGRPQMRLGDTVLQGTAGSVTAGRTVVLAVRYDASTGRLELWDSSSGNTSTATVATNNFVDPAAMFVGGSVNSDQYMKGFIGEVKIFRGVMDTSAFAAERGELAYKWIGLQTPAGLRANSGSGIVTLDWSDQAADFFTVYRATETGGPYTPIATNLATSEYTDPDVTVGTRYYYVVSATKDDDESPQSAEVSITPYIAVSGNELYIHLDASVAASVETTGGIVNRWSDLTSGARDAVAVENGEPPVPNVSDSGDVLYPGSSLSASGLAGLDMGAGRNLLLLANPAAQDAWLDFSNSEGALPYSGFSVFIALKADAILGAPSTDQARDVVLANADNIGGKFVIRYQSGRPEMYLNGVAAVQGGNRIAAGDTVILAANYNAATGSLEFWDSAAGSSALATVARADFSSGSNMYLGGSLNLGQRMHGMIGEVKIHRGTMTPEEFTSERDALVNKWITETAGGFSAWQTANNTTGGIDEDHDADGVSNGVEYFLGGNTDTTGFTPLPSVVNTAGALSITWVKGSGYSGNYGTDHWIETSTTLSGAWTMETLNSGNVSEEAGFVKYTFPAPLSGKRFVRLNVTRP